MVYYSNNLTLFSSEIDPRRNLFIDDIEQYLASLSSTVTLDDFKRFTPSETVSVRVSVTDAQMAFGAYLTSRWNYARVLYEDDSLKNSFSWYYFVTSIEMVADGTLSISLQLDALNTFRNWKGALTDRTFVTRQLVNRWDENGKPDNVFTPEDISGEIIKEEEYQIAPKRGYLIYDSKTGTESKPCLRCAAAEGMPFKNDIFVGASIWDANKTVMPSIAIHLIGTGKKKITIGYSTDSSKTKTLTTYLDCYVGHVYSTMHIGVFVSPGNSQAPIWSEDNPLVGCYIKSLSVKGEFTAKICSCSMGSDMSALTFSDEESLNSKSISEIDRTSSSLVKIVEIPFLPDVSGQGTFTWDGNGKNLYFSDIESQLRYSTKVKLDNLITSKPSIWKKSQALLSDPKMLSSPFSYYKIVYDSYSLTISLDNILADSSYFTAEWIGSATMSSSSIVRLHAWDSTGAEIGFANAKEDYPFMLSSDRNNEIPLYSSEWLNYLRNGYNFDKKSNAMSIATSVLSTVGSLVMGVATIATGGASAAATIPAAVGMAGAAVSGWTSTASTINSQLAKETQMKNQSFSVSSVNDLSLFKAYGNATVKVEWWTPREDYKRRLGQLFFYRGYAVNEMKEPSVDVRTSFDYIECVPSWSGSFIQRTPPQFISLLNDRLAQGVTIIHHYDDAWDIAQEKGNLEK